MPYNLFVAAVPAKKELSKHSVMQMYAVMLTVVCICFSYVHVVGMLGYPLVLVMRQVYLTHGRQALLLAILGLLVSVQFTLWIRHGW